jgi:hypothetical protein
MLGRTVFAATLALAVAPTLGAARAASAAEPPGIRIWTAHSDTYRRGERVRVFFRTEADAYVTIFRVDTDGRLRVLFPHEPWDANLAHGGETYTVPGVDDRDAFYVDDYPGVGYVFAVASQGPFDYDALTAADHWSLATMGTLVDGRIHGDPYSALQDLVARMEPDGYADYDTHLLPYYVEQHYSYPRFLCYDCHAYTPYLAWNPYSHFCSRFSLFVYYDPFYYYPSYWYPTRYYRGTNVVYVRPRFRGSEYVFKAVTGRSTPTVVYRDRRGIGDTRGPADRGVRGIDLGGVGSIPAPGSGRRMVGGGAVTGRRDAPTPPRVVRGAAEPSRRYAQPGPGAGAAGGAPSGKAYTPSSNAPGRRGAEPAAATPGASPARRYIGSGAPSSPQAGAGAPRRSPAEAQRPPRVYIDPGMRAAPREQRAPAQRPAAAAGRSVPSASPAPRGERGYGAPQPSRPSAPRASPRGESRPSPRSAAPGGQSRPAPRSAAPRGQSRPASRGSAPSLVRRRP